MYVVLSQSVQHLQFVSIVFLFRVKYVPPVTKLAASPSKRLHRYVTYHIAGKCCESIKIGNFAGKNLRFATEGKTPL